MSDNGAAMTATEISEGLARLGVLHQTTLPWTRPDDPCAQADRPRKNADRGGEDRRG